MSDDKKIVERVVMTLPLERNKATDELIELPFEQIQRVVDHEMQDEPSLGQNGNPHYFRDVLLELEKFKDVFGGTPVFGDAFPQLNFLDSRKKIFGIPLAAVKDWFSMVLAKEWPPKYLWRKLAIALKVSPDQMMSKYEDICLRIQRFGLLIDNKKRIFQILDRRDNKRYEEFSTLTGLAWHPDKNDPSVEKHYIEFLENFFTHTFVEVKEKGEEALKEFFYSFSGVCFEDRIRSMLDFTHLILGNAEAEAEAVPDWTTKDPVEVVFLKEAQFLALQIAHPPKPAELFSHLQKKGIFELEFPAANGELLKPTPESYGEWAKEQVEACILEEEENRNLSFTK